MKNAMNLDQIKNALFAANAAYIARKGEGANLDKDGINPDIKSALSTVSGMGEPQITAMQKVCDLPKAFDLIAQASNIKKALRAVDLFALLATDNVKYLRGSARAFVLEYAGIMLAGAKSREGMRTVATGKGDENTSDHVKSLANARKLRTACGSVGITSIQTQESVSFAKGGLAEIVGAIEPGTGARGKMPALIEGAQINKALNAWFEKLTDGKIALIAEKQLKGAK